LCNPRIVGGDWCVWCMFPLYPPVTSIPAVTLKTDTTESEGTPQRSTEGHYVSIRVLRQVKVDGKWEKLPMARDGQRIDCGHVALKGRTVSQRSWPYISTEPYRQTVFAEPVCMSLIYGKRETRYALGLSRTELRDTAVVKLVPFAACLQRRQCTIVA